MLNKASKKKNFHVISNLSLLAGTVVVTLLVLEIIARILISFDHNSLDNLVSEKALSTIAATRAIDLADIIRLHPDNKIVYELRPHTKGIFVGQYISINSHGMRDKERSIEKPPGVFRIVALGDSHTFGWGVKQNEAWPAILEDMLMKNNQSIQYEVLNMGVPGYNAVQEVQVFATKALAFDPDMVIINFIDNDMDLPNFLAYPLDPLSLDTSYLYDFVLRRIELLKGKIQPPLGLNTVSVETKTMRFRMPLERVPDRFLPLYGYDKMEEAYRMLARICRERAIPCAVLFNFDDYRHRLRGSTPTVILPHVREFVKRVKNEGYIIIDPQDRIFNYLKENDLGFKAVWVSDKDPHANSIRHRLMAEEVFEQITDKDLLQKTVRVTN